MRTVLLKALCICALVSYTHIGISAASIATSLFSGDPYSPNSQFVIQVAVVSNDTGQIPESYALRIKYDAASCIYQGIADAPGFSFDPLIAPEEGTAPTNFRDVNGDYIGNSNATPILFRVAFQTTSNPSVFSITIEDDPDNDAFLDANIDYVAHSFSNTATESLPVELDWMIVQ